MLYCLLDGRARSATELAAHLRRLERQRLVKLVTAMHDSQGWKDALQKNGWQDTFLAGDDFDSFITKEIATTEGVLKDLGLVK